MWSGNDGDELHWMDGFREGDALAWLAAVEGEVICSRQTGVGRELAVAQAGMRDAIGRLDRE
jgi:ABC-type nitrate/sulfonate/bicarbonate transport system permease component